MRAKRTKADKVFFICLRGLLYSEVAPQTLDKKEEKLIRACPTIRRTKAGLGGMRKEKEA